jgi:DNA-directed RNA polymerase subunit K/omega
MNKYEMIIAAAREARRLNDAAKMAGRELKIRPTVLAWERMQTGKINVTYDTDRFEDAVPAAEPAPAAEETPAEES